MNIPIKHDVGQQVWLVRSFPIPKHGTYDGDVAQAGITKALIPGIISKILVNGERSEEGTNVQVRYVINTGSAKIVVSPEEVSKEDISYPTLLLGDLEEAELNIRNPSRSGEPVEADL